MSNPNLEERDERLAPFDAPLEDIFDGSREIHEWLRKARVEAFHLEYWESE